MIVPSSDQSWIGVANAASAALNDRGDDATDSTRHQLLVVRLDGSDYAIAIECVRVIVRMRDLTLVPRTPEWLLGVMALRGEVVEVVDLRARLRLPKAKPSRSSRIIVLHGADDRVTGILVDEVSEVLRVSSDEILPADTLELTCVTSICDRDDGFVSILDMDRLLEFDHG